MKNLLISLNIILHIIAGAMLFFGGMELERRLPPRRSRSRVNYRTRGRNFWEDDGTPLD